MKNLNLNEYELHDKVQEQLQKVLDGDQYLSLGIKDGLPKAFSIKNKTDFINAIVSVLENAHHVNNMSIAGHRLNTKELTPIFKIIGEHPGITGLTIWSNSLKDSGEILTEMLKRL